VLDRTHEEAEDLPVDKGKRVAEHQHHDDIPGVAEMGLSV
jgi:hypothetical protein